MRYSSYEALRGTLQVGDIVAFSGKGNISQIIKRVTRSPVSHVGAILSTQVVIEDQAPTGRLMQMLIEAAFSGVTVSRLRDAIDGYEGGIWVLPLHPRIRQQMRTPLFVDFCLHAQGHPYDFRQALGSALDALDKLGRANTEDYAKFFCSELIAAALEYSGAIGEINASEITPQDLVEMQLYAEAVQIKGPPTDIPNFNTVAQRSGPS